MNAFLEKLLAHGPVLTDGAWGTELQARGLSTGDFPDAWNLSHRDRVLEVARAYVAAGSQVILTNTFGSNRVRLAGHGDLANRVVELNRVGVEISLEAAGRATYVFASIGPSGKMLMTGETTEEELRAAYEEQARAIAAAGAHAIVVETMADLAEARIAAQAAAKTGLPVVACMVYDSGKGKDRTMMGNTPEDCARTLSSAGADVIGANCGQGIEGFIPICQRLRAATDRPLWMKANAGLPEMVNDRPVYRVSPESFAAQVPALLEAGANFIGGCCGTSPSFIAAARTALAGHR